MQRLSTKPNSFTSRSSVIWIVVIVTVFLFSKISIAQQGKIYWSDTFSDTIERANFDGTNWEVILSGIIASGLALDVTARHLYYAHGSEDRIYRANLDGTNPSIVVNEVPVPEHIRLDIPNRKIYWVEALANEIQRANFSGTNKENLVTDIGNVGGFDLDLVNQKIYWTDTRTGARGIYRSNLNGSNVEQFVPDSESRPENIAINPSRNKMYWFENRTNTIQSANLDGSNIFDVILDVAVRDLRIDVSGEKLYWINTTGIYRASLDGSNVEKISIVSLFTPSALALGFGIPTIVEEHHASIPNSYYLSQNYPNPFNSGTTIQYQIPTATHVTLEITDTSGQRVALLVNNQQLAGSYTIRWNGKNLSGMNIANGVYLYRLQASDFTQVYKLILLK